MLGCQLWELDVASSNPAAPTIPPVKYGLSSTAGFPRN